MGLFIKRTKLEKIELDIIARIQIIFVEKAIKQYEKEGKDRNSIAALVTIYGLALAFINIEEAFRNERIDKDEMLKLKSDLIEQSCRVGFNAQAVDAKTTETFAKYVYDVLKMSKCKTGTEVETAFNNLFENMVKNIKDYGNTELLKKYYLTLQQNLSNIIAKIKV